MNLMPSPLLGRVAAPPSKSAVHRALIAAMLAAGESVLMNIEESDDIAATRKAIETLGARVRKGTDGTGRSWLTVTGGLPRPGEAVIDCGESGSTLRFLVPVALTMGGTVTFTGAGRLPQRPMQPYFALFDRCGVCIPVFRAAAAFCRFACRGRSGQDISGFRAASARSSSAGLSWRFRFFRAIRR